MPVFFYGFGPGRRRMGLPGGGAGMMAVPVARWRFFAGLSGGGQCNGQECLLGRP